MAGLITICVPTHRRPKLLVATLKSCLSQNYRPLEIDIGDDSSDDDSKLLLASLTVPDGINLRYWRNVPSLGQSGNVNALFSRARGERLVLIHDDDFLLPGAVEAMADAWHKVSDVVAVYGMQQYLHDNGAIDLRETDRKARYFKRDESHAGIQRDLLVSALWRQFPNNGYLIDTRTAQQVGYRPFEDVGHACDADFSIRLAMLARGRAFVLINRATSQYRNNLTSLSRSADCTWKLYDYLLSLDGLNTAEANARDLLLSEIAAQATKDNALGGRRRAALKIFSSRYYPHARAILKSFFHLGLILSPSMYKLRALLELLPALSGGSPSPLRSGQATQNMIFKQLPAPSEASNVNVLNHCRVLTITLISQEVRYGHGQGRANLELVRACLRAGHHVNLIASDVDSSISDEPNLTVHAVNVKGLKTQLIRDAVFNIRAQRLLKTLRGHTDIIHTNGAVVNFPSDINAVHFVYSSFATIAPGILSLLTSPYQLYQHAYTLLNRLLEQHSFRRAASLVAVSERVAQQLADLGVDRRRISVIYNGTDLDEFFPGHEDRAALRLPPKVPLGLFVGDIKGTRKNLDSVLRALVSNTTLHLAVVANPERSLGPALAQELGISDRVHFLGERRDVAAIMRAADVLIFPSRYEPFGMVVLEALASALPVITSRAAGASEILECGSGIVINDANDVEELASAIMVLMNDPIGRLEMGRKGRLTAQNYSWQKMAAQYLDRYASFVSIVDFDGAVADEPGADNVLSFSA